MALVSLIYLVHPVFWTQILISKWHITQFGAKRHRGTLSAGFRNGDVLLFCVNSPKRYPLFLLSVNVKA